MSCHHCHHEHCEEYEEEVHNEKEEKLSIYLYGIHLPSVKSDSSRCLC